MPRREHGVLIVGGGIAALEAALALRDLGQDRIDVELLAPDSRFSYRAASVAQPFALGEAKQFDLSEVAAAAGASLRRGSLASVDAARHEARTSNDDVVPYGMLLVACGAVPKAAVAGALTFRGPADVGALTTLLGEVEAGEVRRLTFAAPWGALWVLPLYELALMTAARLAARDIRGVELALVTPESEPLQVFGSAASESIRDLLDEREISVHTRCHPLEARDGELRLVEGGAVPADRVVALPRLHGLRIDGVPQTIEGFIPVDGHGWVFGVEDVFAAGDITTFPIKQGGIAAQQAQAAAEAIAAQAGVELEPTPFRPVLRGLLLTGRAPRYLRREIAGGGSSWVSETPLWWPPAKIVGRRLAPFLAELAGAHVPDAEPPDAAAVQVDVELESPELRRMTTWPFPSAGASGSTTVVRDVMTAHPLVVAPEDTLGEVAERMSELDVSSALAADHGRLIGILTARDLVRALAGRTHSSQARVRQWMTAEPIAVSPETTIEAAALLMTENGVHHLPVVEDDRPVGMVGLRAVTRRVAAGAIPVGLGY
jgi:sulfide:quinone oxidoreductase